MNPPKFNVNGLIVWQIHEILCSEGIFDVVPEVVEVWGAPGAGRKSYEVERFTLRLSTHQPDTDVLDPVGSEALKAAKVLSPNSWLSNQARQVNLPFERFSEEVQEAWVPLVWMASEPVIQKYAENWKCPIKIRDGRLFGRTWIPEPFRYVKLPRGRLRREPQTQESVMWSVDLETLHKAIPV